MKEGQSNQALSVMGKADVQKSDSEAGRSTLRERAPQCGELVLKPRSFDTKVQVFPSHPRFPASLTFQG